MDSPRRGNSRRNFLEAASLCLAASLIPRAAVATGPHADVIAASAHYLRPPDPGPVESRGIGWIVVPALVRPEWKVEIAVVAAA